MNTETKENGVVVIPQREMFGNLFPAESELGRSTRQKVGKSGAVRLSLLPMRSKSGESLASVTGLTGAALDAARRRLSDDFKVKMGGVAGMAGSSGEYTGGSMTIRKNGDIALLFKKSVQGGMTKAQVLAQLTDEERKEIAESYLENSETPAKA